MALRGNRPGFFCGGWWRGAWVPGGCGDFSPLLRFAGGTGGGMLRLCGAVITGQGSRRKLPGFFAEVGRWGCGFPADAKVFSFCGAVVMGQGSRRKLPVFLRGLAVGGRSFCKGRGCGARGWMIADFMRGGGGEDFAGAAGGAFLRFYYKSGGCVAFRGLRRYNNLIE